MDDPAKPDKRRLLAALNGKVSDRVPNLEFSVMQRNLRSILGHEVVADVEERYRRLETVWPARSASEADDRSPLARLSCYLPPEEYRVFLERTGQDAVVCTLSWKPKPRTPDRDGAVAMGQQGVVRGREDLDRLPPPPPRDGMLGALDAYVRAFEGSGIGVGVLLRSVFCNTYETLGMENFMLTMHDDPGVIESLFDVFHRYSLEISRSAAQRDVDFLAIDDDLCDNNGFLVDPSFLRSEWVWRTRQIMEPFLAKGLPVIHHCCGNVKPLIPMAIDMGMSALHPLQPNCNDIYAYRRAYGSHLCLMGNMDLAGVLSSGTPEEVRADTRKHIAGLAAKGGYIVASSHSITDDVPPENYRAMIETAWRSGPG